MPGVKVNDIKIFYEMHGEGAPLLLIMGWTASSEDWDPQLLKDLSRFYRVIVFDNRGTGRSDKPDVEYSIGMMTDDVVGLLEAINIQKAHVLGFSMGGMIAQELALRHPEKVSSLILCGTSCGGLNSVQLKQETQRAVSTIMNPPPEMKMNEMMMLFMRLIYTTRYIQENKEDIIKAWMSMKYPTPPYVHKRQFQAILDYDSYDQLPDLGVPTLVLTGEEDVMIPPENSGILADRIPDAQLHTFKGAAHMFLEEVREQAASVILNFLSRVPRD
jgi:pimeloyl-ACP methyl ester carboxylesterase